MSIIQHQSPNPNQSFKMIMIIIAVLVAYVCFCSGCAASNKAHWQRIHPNGAYAGKNWINGIDTTNTVKK